VRRATVTCLRTGRMELPSDFTPRLDPRCFHPTKTASKSTDFSGRITTLNQWLKNPYQIPAVQSFGENRPEREKMGLRRGSLGQQLWCRNRAGPGVFRGPEGPGRISARVLLAEGTGFELSVRTCSQQALAGPPQEQGRGPAHHLTDFTTQIAPSGCHMVARPTF
jgi:hypothetical protein